MGEDDRAEPRPDVAGIVQRMIAGGAAATFGYSVGRLPGAALAAMSSPALEPLAGKVWGEIGPDARRRQTTTLAAACDAMGGADAAALEERIMASEQSRLQAGIALDAASRTAWPPKVIALGRALAVGLTADDKIDSYALILAALADIEVPHAFLLELLTGHWPRMIGQQLTAELYVPALGASWSVGQRIWHPADIGSARPRLSPALPSLLGTLQRHGLVTRGDSADDPFSRTGREMNQRFVSDLAARHQNAGAIPGYAPSRAWVPTELGQEVMDLLLEAGAEFTNAD
jgi:hypothetical protein